MLPVTERAAGFRPDIQGLRGLAVLLVVVYHATSLLPGGFVGVDVFFVVSGYVITLKLLRELATTGRVCLTGFYLGRIRRLLPALGLLLVVVVLSSVILLPIAAQRATANTGVATALFNANTYLLRFGGDGGYFGIDAETNPLLHMWSLSLEEQFYFVFPGVLVATWAIAVRLDVSPRRVAGLVLGVGAVVSLGLSVALTHAWLDPSGLGSELAFYAAPARAWEFAVGALLALAAHRTARLARPCATACGFAGMSMVMYSALTFSEATAFPGYVALVPVVGTALLIVGGEGGARTAVVGVLEARPAQLLGDVSYSWYLWHWPIIVFGGALWPTTPWVGAAAAIASLLPAWLSFRVVEQPLRLTIPVRRRQTFALGLVCVIVPILATTALDAGNRRLAESALLDEFGLHADVTLGCDPALNVRADGDQVRCRWSVADASGTAVLIGDSNAGQFTEGFVAGALRARFDAVVATRSGCPPIDLVLVDDGETLAECRVLVEAAFSALEESPPDIVVLAAASDIYIREDRWVLRSPDGEEAVTEAAKAAVWQESLARTLATLEGAGIDVVMIHPVPKLDPGWKPIQMAPLRLASKEFTDTSVLRSSAQAYRSIAVAAEIAAAGGETVVVDLFDHFCPDVRCRAHDGERWLYRDARHLSVAASQSLTATFRDELLRVSSSPPAATVRE